MKKLLCCVMILTASALYAAEPEGGSLFTAQPVNGQTIGIMKDSASYLDFSVMGWKPGWKFLGLRGTPTGSSGVMTARNTGKLDDAEVVLTVKAAKTGPDQLQLNYELSSSSPAGITLIAVGMLFNPGGFSAGQALVKTADGTQTVVPFPLGRTGLGKKVKECVLVDNAGLRTSLAFDPACDILSDNQGRIVLAEGTLAAPVFQTVTVTLPGALDFYASATDIPADKEFDSWYPFTATGNGSKAGEIGLQDWLEKPAGKYGRITRDREKLIYNGKPIKLWGINSTYVSCAPEKSLAEKRAAFYSKYGINAVRLHKYADGTGWAGIQTKSSFTEFDPAVLDRMDYFVSKLKDAGIYVTLSPTFGVKPGPADQDRIPYLGELGRFVEGRMKTGGGTVFLSRELQDMQIEQTVKFLTHKNPYTGKTYAEETAVAAIELLNEESILFFNTGSVLKKSPTLCKRTSEAFCDWLKARYGSKEKLLAAWGQDALNCLEKSAGVGGESWEDKTIVPFGNPFYYDTDQMNSPAGHKARMLDTMQFLYELQNSFYSRYAKAIRDTGYTGELLASNWQAGRDFSHYYNLHSDAMIGLIDRHNYFGAGSKGGGAKINNASALAVPGSGMLSAGLQQVGDRPFMLSEWINVTPNEWGVEGPAVIGAYGMGLQGWDVSLIFQNNDIGVFLEKIPSKGWNVMAPHVLGVFPAVARQVLRGDIKESDVTSVRNVHVPSLHEGRLGFSDRVEQDGDTKEITSDKAPPMQALAATRCAVNFTDTYTDTPVFDLNRYMKNGGIESVTGELFWKPGQNKTDGFFTINAAATKAVVGFAKGRKCVLDGVTIEPESRFGAIYVSAQGRDETIAAADHLLVTAIARSRNTGMKIVADSLLLEEGRSPVVMEPVKARITLQRKPVAVYLLDHDGVRTANTLPVENGSFGIDGARDKTCYYLVTFK